MRQKGILFIALCCVCLCGCDEYEYTIRMEPDGDEITREIVCSENMPDEVRAKLNELYDKRIDKNTFEGSFGENLPDDVGGFGRHMHLNNPMGDVYIYVERFRGKDAQALEMEEAFSNADRLVDILVDWLQTELGDDPSFDKLRTFCNETLREDIKNVSMYGWLSGRASGDASETQEAFARVFLYLYERGYFTLDDFGGISTSTDTAEFALSYFRRIITEKLGYSDENKIEEGLRFLQDPNSLKASLERFSVSRELHDRLTIVAREQSGDPDLVLDPCDIPEMMEEMSGKFYGMFFVDLFGSSRNRVNIRLTFPRKPYETNGQWDERSGQLHWSQKIGSVELPLLCYAVAGVANDTFQEDHFGKAILQDEQLVQYSFWYKGLSTEQRTEWDDLIVGLDGDEDVRSKVESFRFKLAGPLSVDGDGATERLSDLPRGLIGEGLKTNEEKSQELNASESAGVQDRSFAVHPIGKVLKKDGRSFIVLDKEYQGGLKGLEKHSYVTVVYWFDKNDTPEKRAILEVHPRGDKSNPLTGVFATHSPFRPNLLAITKCDIIEVRENIIEVKDIDAFDGSPVLDLKGDFFRFHRPKTQ